MKTWCAAGALTGLGIATAVMYARFDRPEGEDSES